VLELELVELELSSATATVAVSIAPQATRLAAIDTHLIFNMLGLLCNGTMRNRNERIRTKNSDDRPGAGA
jgi:hypothetical protein